MLCDLCHKNIATVHLTEVLNDKVTEMHICQICAKSKTDELKEQLNISDLLGGLADNTGLTKEDSLIKCRFCGLTYADFKKKGRLGCAFCYSTFNIQLVPLLRKIHGAAHHRGKSPLQKNVKVHFEAKIKELRGRLERAINLEEYETAAKLRDEIKKLEGEQKK
jgi:protein arginine kinase activator